MLYGASQEYADPQWTQDTTNTRTQLSQQQTSFSNACQSSPSEGYGAASIRVPRRHSQLCGSHQKLNSHEDAAATALSQSQYLTARAATQPSASQGDALNPLNILARQKARYARTYAPPPALRHSRLQQLPTGPMPDARDASHRQQQSRRSPPPTRAPLPSPERHSSMPVRSQMPTQNSLLRATAVKPLNNTTDAAAATEVRQERLLALHERQLDRLQQIVESQHRIASALDGMREELQCVCRRLRDPRAQLITKADESEAAAVVPTVAVSQKRCRPPSDRTPADVSSKRSCVPESHNNRDAHRVRGPAQHVRAGAGTAAEVSHVMTVRSVRLIGGSTSSTQIVAREEEDAAGNDSCGGGRGGDTLLPREQIIGDDTADVASEAADSEKDLFLL